MSTFEESIADIKIALKDDLLLDPYDVKRLLGNYEALIAERDELWQTSGVLCSECGWRFVIPSEGCYHCKVDVLTAENADLKKELKRLSDLLAKEMSHNFQYEAEKASPGILVQQNEKLKSEVSDLRARIHLMQGGSDEPILQRRSLLHIS